MRFQANMAARLKANSELLLIDSIDEEAAIAFCRRIGGSGPEGVATAYPLDSLRENVMRASRVQETHQDVSPIRKAMCFLGLHSWKQVTFGSRPPLGEISGETCMHCAEIRLAQGASSDGRRRRFEEKQSKSQG